MKKTNFYLALIVTLFVNTVFAAAKDISVSSSAPRPSAAQENTPSNFDSVVSDENTVSSSTSIPSASVERPVSDFAPAPAPSASTEKTISNSVSGVKPVSSPKPSTSKEKSLNQIVVIVNDSVITQDEVNQGIVVAKKQLQEMKTPLPSEEELKKQVINNLINRELQQQLMRSMNINISDSELDGAIESIAKRNNISLALMRTELAKSGTNYKEYREQVREQMMLARLQQEQVGRVTVSDKEVSDFLSHYKNVKQPDAEYHLQNILVPLPDKASKEDVQKAQQETEKLLAKIRSGADFSQVAAANSGDEHALEGGDLGWRRLAQMPPVFANAAKDMKAGEVRSLRAPNGFHILKVVEIRQSEQKLNKDAVRALIYQRKFEEKVQQWLRGVRDSAYIKFV